MLLLLLLPRQQLQHHSYAAPPLKACYHQLHVLVVPKRVPPDKMTMKFGLCPGCSPGFNTPWGVDCFTAAVHIAAGTALNVTALSPTAGYGCTLQAI
jgi:hypothetical protein